MKQNKSNAYKCYADKRYHALYRRAMQATRGGPLFNAFPYPTKISPETIALFIATHTNPGQVVFDGFAGSGTTGLGALLCANPTEDMKSEASKHALSVRWGPRKVVLYEISVLGSFIARVLCSPPDPDEFLCAAERLLAWANEKLGWLYMARDPCGRPGVIRYVIWSDILECPSCHDTVPLWDVGVSREPARITGVFHCPYCKHEAPLSKVERVTEMVDDYILKDRRKIRLCRPAWVYGSTDGRSWSRKAVPSDLRLLARISKEPPPHCVPKVAIPWGDLYRAGYHQGITHLHHFYTRRNLITFGMLWAELEHYPAQMKDALRFWLLSYNASHSTIMTRVVAKKGQKDLVVTSSQPGVLYISGLPVEKNILIGLRRKLGTIVHAFRTSFGQPNLINVRNSSCLSVDLPNESVDYIFTDPPFGGNIPYAEVNFLNEAWLGRFTNIADEIIISAHQGKGVNDYQRLLSSALKEANRILRKDGKATVVFHSTAAQVWNALRFACDEAGFNVAQVNILDKTQGSFKQVTANGSVRGDPIILLTKVNSRTKCKTVQLWDLIEKLIKEASMEGELIEMTPQRLYSRLIANYIAHHQNIPIDANEFYSQLAERRAKHGRRIR